MATSKQRSDLDEQRLIERHVDPDHDRYGGRGDARLKAGPSIWAVVTFLDVYEGDRDELAGHFGISQEEIDAALAYYRHNQRFVDARITLNESWDGSGWTPV